MKYCIKCLYPDTKPDLFFQNGICSACTAFEEREKIDWIYRESQFKDLIHRQKIKYENRKYDCIIPVSGGKDSHFQVIKALEYGLNPLAVTATTDHLSSLGRSNLTNISKLVDHIEVSVNTKVRRKINAYTLREIGDISWTEHITIFTVPYYIAVNFNVPLIIWGENPQNEYGGPECAQKAMRLDERWLAEYGGLNGLRVSDLLEEKIATQEELELYTFPKLDIKPVSGIFLGQFMPWNGAENALVARKYGFKTWYGPVEGTGYDYENLDNHQTGIHDYFKYLKFGFGRCTDIVSNHIRRKNITRNEGIEIAKLYDGRYPNTYLGMPLIDILEPLEIDIPEFLEICNKFANKTLFECKKGKIPKSLFKLE